MKQIQHHGGFTIIELLIVIVIIGIIAIIATGIYKSFALQSRRADGVNAILTLQLSEEQYRSTNSQYGSITQIGGSATSPQGYYSLVISNLGATTFTITATAQGTQANDSAGSTSCATLTLTVSSGTVTQTPTACWPS